jgi:hypothetical protein
MRNGLACCWFTMAAPLEPVSIGNSRARRVRRGCPRGVEAQGEARPCDSVGFRSTAPCE